MQIQTDLIDSLEFSLHDIKRASCEGFFFTKDELFSALKGLQTSKSPGSDGLPTEFYLSFWDDLGDFLVLVLNEDTAWVFLHIASARVSCACCTRRTVDNCRKIGAPYCF